MNRPSPDIIRFLGENEIILLNGTPGSFKTLTPDVQSRFAAQNGEIMEALHYIEEGKENGGDDALYWLKKLHPVEVPDGDTLKMNMKYNYTTFELSWSAHDAFETTTSDVEVREMTSAHNIGITIFYPYDTSATREERSSSDVCFWIIEWDARRAYTIDADMSDHNLIRISLMPFLRYCKSVPSALEWLSVVDEYKTAKNTATTPFNPLR